MLRKIGLTLLCAAATLSANSYAMINHSLQAGVTVEYEFEPNEPQIFTNYMFWPIEAVCIITSEDESGDLFVEAITKKGKINDITLTAGESLHVAVHNGDQLKLFAESGSRVKITSFSQHKLKTTCTA